jgi:hypothetical protein
VLIYVPSISRFRLVYLEDRISAAHLATLSLEAAGTSGVDPTLENELLSQAGVLSITLREPAAELMLGKLPPVEKVFDLRGSSIPSLIMDAFEALWHAGRRTIRVIGPSPHRPEVLVDISLSEQAMWNGMADYSWRILALSVALSLLTALLVFASLQLMIVRPLRRINESVVEFRRRPEDPSVDLPGSPRSARSTTICATSWRAPSSCPTGSTSVRIRRCATSPRAWWRPWSGRRGCAARP